MLLHGLTTHIGSVNAAGSLQPRVAQFARYCHTEMREQAPLVMFPDKDGTPWSPPAPSPQVGNTPVVPDEQAAATGFLPPGHPRPEARAIRRAGEPLEILGALL